MLTSEAGRSDAKGEKGVILGGRVFLYSDCYKVMLSAFRGGPVGLGRGGSVHFK